jgi:hypothetical protein
MGRTLCECRTGGRELHGCLTTDVESRRDVGRRYDGVCLAAEVVRAEMRQKRALEGAIAVGGDWWCKVRLM